ncbi:hypothetical protein FAIPA1_70017 [Frankia sp. AiPs1]|uniref:hypothetical protein n=1 Tax=Frankia sp. AiPa1 TaxID=573492 RepID=UPI00202AEF50|nr:hypothetical protein [Frankia sp. AiPa1]MCL9759442.1 hypothetical protein [Frankia sp. AiPa1]
MHSDPDAVVVLDLRGHRPDHRAPDGGRPRAGGPPRQSPPAPMTSGDTAGMSALPPPTGDQVPPASRLVLVTTSVLADLRAALDPLLAARDRGAALVLLVGTPPTRLPDGPHRPARGEPIDSELIDGNPLDGNPMDGDFSGESDDLDATYDPDRYSFLEVGSAELARAPLTGRTRSADQVRPADRIRSAHRLQPRGQAGTTGGVEATGAAARITVTAVPSIAAAAAAAGPSQPEPDPRVLRSSTDRSPTDRPPTHDDLLGTILEALRTPEVFDRVCRDVAAAPGHVVLPRIGAVIGGLPEQTLRGLRSRPAGEPRAAGIQPGSLPPPPEPRPAATKGDPLGRLTGPAESLAAPTPSSVGAPRPRRGRLPRRAPRNRLGRFCPWLPTRMRRFAPLAATAEDLPLPGGGNVGDGPTIARG